MANFGQTDIDNAIDAQGSSNTLPQEQPSEFQSEVIEDVSNIEQITSDVYDEGITTANGEEDVSFVDTDGDGTPDFVVEGETADDMSDASDGARRGSFGDNAATPYVQKAVQFLTEHAAEIITAAVAIAVVSTFSIVAIKAAHNTNRTAVIQSMLTGDSDSYFFGSKKLTRIVGEFLKLGPTEIEKKVEAQTRFNAAKRTMARNQLTPKKRAKLQKEWADKAVKDRTMPLFQGLLSAEDFKLYAKKKKLEAKSSLARTKHFKNKHRREADAISLKNEPNGIYMPNDFNLNRYISIDVEDESNPAIKKAKQIDENLPMTDRYTITLRRCRIDLYAKDTDEKPAKTLVCSFDNETGYELMKSLLIQEADKLVQSGSYARVEITDITREKGDKYEWEDEPESYIPGSDEYNELITERNTLLKRFDELIEGASL